MMSAKARLRLLCIEACLVAVCLGAHKKSHNPVLDRLKVDIPKLSSEEKSDETTAVKLLKAESGGAGGVCQLNELLRNNIILGEGSFGKVELVKDPHSGNFYALKIVSKVGIKNRLKSGNKTEQKAMEHLKQEKNIWSQLSESNVPCVAKLRTTYQDKDNVYFLADLYICGSLFDITHPIPRKRNLKGNPLSEKAAAFHVACVVLALKAMDEQGMIHRDLKPQNILVDENGYSHITDFGYAKKLLRDDGEIELATSPVGDELYIGPELLAENHHYYNQEDGKGGYDSSVDRWTLGMLTYDLLHGRPKFGTIKRRERTFNKRGDAVLDVHEVKGMSCSGAKFIRKLLTAPPEERPNYEEIKQDQWFKDNGFKTDKDWELLREGKMEAPFQPVIAEYHPDERIRNHHGGLNALFNGVKVEPTTPAAKTDYKDFAWFTEQDA